jgi:hypothetical protein
MRPLPPIKLYIRREADRDRTNPMVPDRSEFQLWSFESELPIVRRTRYGNASKGPLCYYWHMPDISVRFPLERRLSSRTRR